MSSQIKVLPGRMPQIQASFLNDTIDAAEAQRVANLAKYLPQGGPQTAGATMPMFVENATGQQQDEFSIYGIDSMTIGPDDSPDGFRRRVVYRGVVPDKKKHAGRFCIGLRTANVGDIVEVATGATPARINSGPPINPAYQDLSSIPSAYSADIVDGRTEFLQLCAYGSADVIWRSPSPDPTIQDVQLGIVRCGNAPKTFPILAWIPGGFDDFNNVNSYTITDLAGRVLFALVNPAAPPHRYVRPNYSSLWFILLDQGQTSIPGFATIIDGAVIILHLDEPWYNPANNI